MDHTIRNETIRALAAASAAEIRSRPDRALRAVSGEIRTSDYPRERGGYPSHTTRTSSMVAIECVELPPRRSTERELPLERTPNYYTGEPRDPNAIGVRR